MKDHDSEKGSKYVRAKKPFKLVYSEKLSDRSSALRREAQVKKWAKSAKEMLVQGRSPQQTSD